MKPICIITARANSKRLKNKNIKNFFGKPMISYPIRTAIKSKIFSEVIVTTDSLKIAKISRRYGAKIPFLREEKLADDFATTKDVMQDAIKRMGSEKVDYHFCIYPTAVLVKETDLIKAFKLMKKKNYDNLIAVSNYDFNPLRALYFENKNEINYYWKKFRNSRSQDLPYLFHDTGTFSIFKTSSIIKNKKKYKLGCYFLDRLRAVDIDNKEDLEFAKVLFKHSKK